MDVNLPRQGAGAQVEKRIIRAIRGETSPDGHLDAMALAVHELAPHVGVADVVGEPTLEHQVFQRAGEATIAWARAAGRHARFIGAEHNGGPKPPD